MFHIFYDVEWFLTIYNWCLTIVKWLLTMFNVFHELLMNFIVFLHKHLYIHTYVWINTYMYN